MLASKPGTAIYLSIFDDEKCPAPHYYQHACFKASGYPKADKSRYYLLTHGSHLVDTARFLGGEIISVQARQVVKFDAYCWFVTLEFANGA